MARILISKLVTLALLLLAAPAQNVAHAAGKPLNACGCYTENDTCYCEKKAKCGCPGECEPKGCEVERQKKLQREIEAETKRATEEAEAAAKARASKAAEKSEKSEEEQSDKASPPPAPENDLPPLPHQGKTPVRRMAPAQKKMLLKLIDAYLVEHPDAGRQTLSDVRGSL
jgi:hypothetical protein